MNGWQAFGAIAGMAVVTIVTRGFFLYSDREQSLPSWLQRGLRYAPLAALAAVVAPEVLMSHGHLIGTWKDARVFATVAALLYFYGRRGILGTIVCGTAVMMSLRMGLGW